MNEHLVELPFETRLLFAGLPCFADREGRLEDRPLKLKMCMFPTDDVPMHRMLDALQEKGFIQRYVIDGSKYIQIKNFCKHQTPHHKESASVIPAPEGHLDSGSVPCEVTPGQRQRIMDRDGHQCLECGVTNDLSIDHIRPVSKGGTSEDTNLQTLCSKCNSSKGNRRTRSVNESSTNRQQSNKDVPRPTCTRLKVKGISNKVKGKSTAKTVPDDLPDFIDAETWNDYLQMRIEKKQTAKPTTLKRLVKDMTTWHGEGIDVNAVLVTSIRAGWTGVFRPDKKKNVRASKLDHIRDSDLADWAARVGAPAAKQQSGYDYKKYREDLVQWERSR